jgi:hypothetical protein
LFQPILHDVDFAFGRLDALFRLLLESMNGPDLIRELDGVDDAKCIASKRYRDLKADEDGG